MKTRIVCGMLAAMTALTMNLFALGEEDVYYVNPDGGRYYHVQRDCAAVKEIYREGMVEIAQSQLAEEPYSHLQPCNRCFGERKSADIPDGTTSFRYRSEYDTAPEDALFTAGSYRAGESIVPGIYTAMADEECAGELRILDSDSQPVQTFSLMGATSLSFCLGEGMRVDIPENCTVRKIAYAVRFQTVGERIDIPHARYMVLVEIPGRQYAVQAIEGAEGYCTVTDVKGEILQQVKLSAGKTAELDLGELCDVFVEFVNCAVWAAEMGEG